jgi:hypothetical protein
MRKFVFSLLVLVLLLSVAVPAFAQDVVIEPSFGYTRNDLIVVGGLVLILAILIIFGGVIVMMARRAFESIPPELLEWFESGPIAIDLTSIEERLDEFFEETPNPIDDHLWEEVKRIVREGIDEALNPVENEEDTAG